MSRFEARLVRLEAIRRPPPVEIKPVSTLVLDYADVIASSARFESLTPKQKITELREDLRKERRPSPVVGLNAKLAKIHLCFRDVTESHLRNAELELLVELGYPDARHPLPPELQEVLDLELFDA